MKTIYRSRLLVSGNAPPLEDGAFLVCDSRIVAVDSYPPLSAAYPDAAVTDFGDAIICPLLVNAHTHLELTDYPRWSLAAGETAAPQDFVDWILQLIRVKRKLKGDDYRHSLGHGIDQSLASGTGIVGDILAHHSAADVYNGTAIQGRLYLETLGRDPAVIEKVRSGLDRALAEENCGHMTKAVSPHSPYTISRTYLQDIYRDCRRRHVLCCTHLAESPDEVDFIQQGRGAMAEKFFPAIGWEAYIPGGSGSRPVAYLDEQGGLFPENLLVHGVQLNDDEIDLLASRKMAIALCPRSNQRLKVGKAPAGKLLDSGVRLALGTDSMASCGSLSIWDEMAFAHTWFAGDLDAPTLFYLATLSGADVLGMADRFGSLEQGKFAAFQVLRPKTTVAKGEVFDYFVAPGCTADIVHAVMGEQVLLSERS